MLHGEPCTPCLIHLWQTGIKKVIHRKAYGGTMVTDRTRKNRSKLLSDTGMQLVEATPDLSWLSDLV